MRVQAKRNTAVGRMNKKSAHIILVFGDLLSIGGLWIGFHLFSQIQHQITRQDDFIKYGNSVGFFFVGIGFPLLHAVSIVEHFFPELIKKYKRFLTHAVIAMLISLLIAGFSGSFWIQSQVENAGYIHCRKAGRGSVLSKRLVYTINTDICDEIAAAEQKQFD